MLAFRKVSRTLSGISQAKADPPAMAVQRHTKGREQGVVPLADRGLWSNAFDLQHVRSDTRAIAIRRDAHQGTGTVRPANASSSACQDSSELARVSMASSADIVACSLLFFSSQLFHSIIVVFGQGVDSIAWTKTQSEHNLPQRRTLSQPGPGK